MNRSLDMVVTNKMVKMEHDRPIFTGEGKFKRIHWNDHQAHGIFERNDTRFQITLTKILDVADTWILSVPSFYYSLEISNPRNVAYKIAEHRDIPVVDAESIQVASRYMQQLMQEYAEQDAKDVRMQLVYAHNGLQNALNLIEEGNADGKQMDYVSHPSLSDTFDGVARLANNIDKIMYQKK